jgi:hypothetical protein
LRDGFPTFDVHAPLVSLPAILHTTQQTVPADIPYLFADPQLVEQWRQKLAPDKNFKVGICWQGNPNYSTHFLRVAVAAKSCSAAKFAPLAYVPGVTLYSLQRETGVEQLARGIPFPLVTFGPEFDRDNGRFMDTAALMQNLDLIITIDTSIAHLAAGLGKPVWILIPNPPDWRWMRDRTDSPWYPNMRLFRQTTALDWDSVIQTVADQLRYYIELQGLSR